jgi:T-complex protein 1 subunit theta
VEFNTDQVRVAKIIGAGVSDSTIVRGFVVPRDAEGQIKHVTAAKVAVFAGGIDLAKTETKGTVLVKTAKELVEYSASEEQAMERAIKAVADAGVKIAVSGSSIGELAMHYMERYQIMVVKVLSKFDLRRLCTAIGASPMLNIGGGAIPADKLGFVDVATVEEIGSTKCCVFRQSGDAGKLATIVIRASTQNVLDDIERAVDDGVNVYRQICRDGRFLAGAGACEMELAIKLATFADSHPGLEQYAIRKFAEAFEVVPRTLAENAGLQHTQIISDLYAAHSQGEKGKPHAGVDIENGGTCDALEAGILDHLVVKRHAYEFAANAVTTILRVDQIIMQKPAGGPKVQNQGGGMDRNDPDVA